MCGLVGFFSPYIGQPDVEKMQFLLMLSSTRGKDSTGVAQIIRYGHYNAPKETVYHYLKSPVHPVKFTESMEWRTMSAFSNTKGWIGHTRAATIGLVNSANAHPFETKDGNIIGAHNGTLTGEYPRKKDYGTDSEALFNTIEAEGLKALNDISGAWALSYFDASKSTVNLIRNRERPLSYVKLKSGDFAYASEAWMLEALKQKYSLGGDVKELEPYKLLSFDLNKENYISSLTITDVEGLEAPKVTHYQQGSFFRGRASWEDTLDWTDREYETQRTGPSVPLTGFSRPVSQTPRSSLIADALKARKEEAQATPEAGEKVIGLDSVRSVLQRGTSTALVVQDSSKKEKQRPHFVKGLHERQRISLAGDIEIETRPGSWLHIEDFLNLIDKGECKWSGEGTVLDELRHWLNPREFILDSVWQKDQELRMMLGVSDDNKPISTFYVN